MKHKLVIIKEIGIEIEIASYLQHAVRWLIKIEINMLNT
jgi:hypothetical protein